MLMLRPYLESTCFPIRTGHESLKWILNLANGTGQMALWHLRLCEFKFDAFHRAGITHQAVSALSLLQTSSARTDPIEYDLPVTFIDTDTLDNNKMRLENDHQELAQVVEVNHSYHMAKHIPS